MQLVVKGKRWMLYMSSKYWNFYQHASRTRGYRNMLRFIFDMILGKTPGTFLVFRKGGEP